MSPTDQDIKRYLPFLRRYARAMSGSRDLGDQMTEQALIDFLGGEDTEADDLDLKVGLFRALQDARSEAPYQIERNTDATLARANRHLARLTPGSRDAFLLRAFEDFSYDEIGKILRRPSGDIEGLIAVARNDLEGLSAGRVLVIEDDLAIADEISTIVTEMGHTVIGTAPTGEDALELAETEEPDIILSDIQLANGGSGIRTVGKILRTYPLTPVVYITGFPERLLTGKGPEPAFLVTKPYTHDQVRSAVSQAMYFA